MLASCPLAECRILWHLVYQGQSRLDELASAASAPPGSFVGYSVSLIQFPWCLCNPVKDPRLRVVKESGVVYDGELELIFCELTLIFLPCVRAAEMVCIG